MENTSLTPEVAAIKDAFIKRKVVSDLDVALASFTVLNEYRHVFYPTAPKEVEEYYKLDRVKKIGMNKNPEKYLNFWQDPEVKLFFDTKVKIKNQNDRNKKWLLWMKEMLEEDHPDKIVAIDLKIYQYGDAVTIDQPDWNE